MGSYTAKFFTKTFSHSLHPFISPSLSPAPFFLSLFFFFIPLLFFVGFLRSTHQSCRSGVTAICGRWVRFPSIGVWTAWTQQGCWPRLNSAREMRATWEPWALSARLVAIRGLCLSAFGPYTPLYLQCYVQWGCAGGGIPSVAILRPELTIRSPSGKEWTIWKPPISQLAYTSACCFLELIWLQA